MHLAEQRHAGHRAEQHADQYRNEGQKNAPTAERQQEQQQDANRGAAADPGDFLAGLALAVGGVQQTTGGQQAGTVVPGFNPAAGEQVGDLQGQLHIERITQGAGTQQYPVLPVRFGHQRAAGGVQLYCGRAWLAVLDAPGQAQPVVLAGHQAEAGKGVVEVLYALLDKALRIVDQAAAVSAREHRQAPLQQLFTQCLQVSLQAPLDLLEQATGLPLFRQALGQGNGLVTLGVADQYQHLAVQRLLHALLGALHQRVLGGAGHQRHQVGRQGRSAVPLPAGQGQQSDQQQQKQPWQQALTRQNRGAPCRSGWRCCSMACAVPCCRPGFPAAGCVRRSARRRYRSA
ncbi:hypothetical protein D3C79_704100 [compost metagenome]